MSAIFSSITRFLVPIHREGYLFAAIATLLAILLNWLIPVVGWIFWLLPIFVLYFFRDPPRHSPLRDGLVLAPGDGKVSMIGHYAPPAELEMGVEPLLRISIFLSVFDVHINRVPVGGVIKRIIYTPGLFLNADLDKASSDNERNALVIESPHGLVGCIQIAGLIARRILCFVKEGESLPPGARYGLIRFGSRCDVYLPATATPLVTVGSRAIGGETVLCDLASSTKPLHFKAD